jgi:hypothetical protein
MEIGDDNPMLLVGADGFRGVLHQLVAEKWDRLTRPGVPELTVTVIREIQHFPISAQQLFRQLSQRYRRRVEAVLNAGVMPESSTSPIRTPPRVRSDRSSSGR